MIHYAIGDVHGERAKLERLLEAIGADARGRAHRIVLLGDMIDKGPDSAGVVRLARALEAEGRAVCIRGNHEDMAVRAGEGTQRPHWLGRGGREMVNSYAGDDAQRADDVAWMAELPTRHVSGGGRFVFVHAGIDPDTYPAGSAVSDMWTRTDGFTHSERWTNPALAGVTVVHGHTPRSDQPDISADGRRINVDTGACSGGPLTAAVCETGRAVRFLSVG